MTPFVDLYRALDGTTKTSEIHGLLVDYFRQAPPADAAWALFYLSGGRHKGLVRTADLQSLAMEMAGIAPWLFDECRTAAGDLSETIALVLPEPAGPGRPDRPLAEWVARFVLPLAELPTEAALDRVRDAWSRLDGDGRLVYNKMLRGGFRVGVSKTTVAKAVAAVAGLAPETIAHRLMGDWAPGPDAFEALLSPDESDAAASRPYPFFLASPLDDDPEALLGDLEAVLVEDKYDGVRAQVVRRDGQTFIWSRGGEEAAHRFPEIAAAAAAVPDGHVLDGEIVALGADGRPRPFADLQRRLNRKTVGSKLLAEVPVTLIAFDLLEHDGLDLRDAPLRARRARLEALVARADRPPLRVAPVHDVPSWDAAARLRTTAPDRGVEGLMLKRADSPYRAGRPKGDWWKWKVDPLTFDAVLLYARAGTGRRASLYTDLDFGLWRDGELVKVCQAYSGLTDAEFAELTRWVRRNTTDRFGPVRQVTPHHVFEIACEGVQPSRRHKAGLAVRFPRIVRWRRDKAPDDADDLSVLQAAAARRTTAP